MVRLALLVLSLALAPTLPAQTGIPAVDSAQVARDLWRAAVRAFQSGDKATALARAVRAVHAWPVQPAYWSGAAKLAAAANDTAVLGDALAGLTRLTAGASLLADRDVMALSSPGAIDELRRATADVAASRVTATLADSTIYAEGVDADPVSGTLYVASVRHRTVYEVTRAGAVRDIGLGTAARMGAVLGVRVAPDRVHLWVTITGLARSAVYAPADSSIAALLQVRRADGRVVRRFDVPADPRGHVLGDLTIGPGGDVFVSDSRAPLLFRLRPGADTLERLTHPLFRSLQGLAVTADGRTMILADYSHGLLRVDLASGAVERIADAPGTTSVGVDGLVLVDGTVIGVQNGIEPARITRFVLSADGRQVTSAHRLDQRSAIADEPTIGTVRDHAFVYVANSQWEKYEDDGRRRAGTRLSPTVLLEVPLPAASAARQDAAGTARKGTRSAASVPPSARSRSVTPAFAP